MAQRSISFLVVLLLIFYGEIFGQENPQNFKGKTINRAKIIRQSIKKINGEQHAITHIPHETFIVWGYSPVTKPDCFGTKTYMIFKPTIYTRDLGWFCKKELQLDKITPLPVRFRLGSLNYVNWMEQKPNAIRSF